MLFLLSIMLVGCAHSRDAFTAKIRKMPDMELVSYYHGLNDRIKGIENAEKLGRRSDETRTSLVNSQSTFFIGGEGYDLVQKQKMVRKEMGRRNLKP